MVVLDLDIKNDVRATHFGSLWNFIYGDDADDSFEAYFFRFELVRSIVLRESSR